MRKWTELIETEIPDDINLSYIVKFCSTTRSLYIKTADQLQRTVEFYEGEEDNRTFKKVTVIERGGKYYLPVNPDENISQANGGGSKMSGTTTWNAVRILQGPKKPRIDITDFTFANRKGSSDFSICPGYYLFRPLILGQSIGVDVPYAYGADCLKQDAVSQASLIGTAFKFVEIFEKSFAVGHANIYGNAGSAKERSKNWAK